jgi:hypothetical protein
LRKSGAEGACQGSEALTVSFAIVCDQHDDLKKPAQQAVLSPCSRRAWCRVSCGRHPARPGTAVYRLLGLSRLFRFPEPALKKYAPSLLLSSGIRLLPRHACRQTLTAEMMRMPVSRGSKIALGIMPSSRPPMNVPTMEPSAMTRTNERFCPKTTKLRSRL